MLRLAPYVFLALLAAAPVQAQPQSLYTEVLARQPGDLLTVILVERTAAQRRSTYNDAAATAVSAGGAVSGGVTGQFGADAQFVQNADLQNRTQQSDALSGTITVRVVDVDPAGNLRIEGERQIDVNGVAQRLQVSGLVRPRDVRAGNTILSYQIAEAVVDYRQDGSLRRRLFSPGTILKVVGGAVLVLAAVFGASQAGGGGE